MTTNLIKSSHISTNDGNLFEVYCSLTEGGDDSSQWLNVGASLKISKPDNNETRREAIKKVRVMIERLEKIEAVLGTVEVS